jgi:hypothetical protein
MPSLAFPETWLNTVLPLALSMVVGSTSLFRCTASTLETCMLGKTVETGEIRLRKRPPFLYGLAHSWSHCAMDSESDVVAHMTGGRVEAVR